MEVTLSAPKTVTESSGEFVAINAARLIALAPLNSTIFHRHWLLGKQVVITPFVEQHFLVYFGFLLEMCGE